MERRKTQAMASHSAIFLLLSIFTFVFLGSEYLYVNMVSRIVEESQTVIAQNYALGVNALGFLIYPLINRSVRERNKTILIFSLSFLSIICIFLIQQHISFSVTLAAGVVLFLLLGVFGGSVHLSGCLHDPDRTHSRPGGNLLRGRHPATVRKQQFGKYRDRGGRGTLCFPCGTECFDHAHTPHPQRSTRIG